ncbi:N-acetylmuramic acid 6-phosphate etherase [Brevibacterium casei]|uniref:N-acetylmuramic acid 6-phosphate etherase n=1 Tax=Brevibacterium casei TaxID=33889 RepID=A0A449D7R9_9MICO|nr:N-acetylmuramic acid 6-phosphate etherase [Brevibacterium casei]VEW13647.1 N-acetylmuramic acid 6-phosphate etherase [Brevibacterium casei]
MTDQSQPAPSADARPRLSPTEQRNPRSAGLDDLDALGVLRLLNTEDRVVIDAVAAALPQLAALVDTAAERMRAGGTVHYFGAGTSGRLGVLDASELMPTFNLEPGRVVGHIAGGEPALVNAVENAEDSLTDGRTAGAALGERDVAIGIAASGSTPYVRGALEAARANGAHTVLISNNPHAPVADAAAAHIVLDTGPEVVTGSTRLKAGTAQKLALNGFSTALMVALGRTWENLMVSVVATNAKLRDRTVRILTDAADLDEAAARDLLARCGDDLKTALVVSFAEVTPAVAAELLSTQDGSVRAAIAAAGPTGGSAPPGGPSQTGGSAPTADGPAAGGSD